MHIYLTEQFTDVINHHRWLQSSFFDLPEITKVVNENPSDKLVGMQQTTVTLPNSLNFANSSNHLFVASSGEQNADSLYFYNAANGCREIKRIDL